MSPKQPWPLARLVHEYRINPEEAAALDHFSPLPIVEQLEIHRAVRDLAAARKAVA